jgi:tripartite ATP-independent transporter DctM subunit
MPIIVLGSIVGGICTATEAAAISVAYAILLGAFVTRKLTLKDLYRALVNGTITSGVVFLLISLASSVTFLLTIQQLPTLIAKLMNGVTTSPFVFTCLVMALLESNAAYIMLVPILAPIADSYGIPPLQFGLLFVLNLVIGHLTPPVGVVLFVTGGVAGISLERMSRAILPFLALQLAVLAICLLFPGTFMFVPRLFGY